MLKEAGLFPLPTPKRCDSEKARNNPSQLRRHSPGLYALMLAEKLPTPRASELKAPRGRTGNRTEAAKKRAGATLTETLLLAEKLPTPTAQEYGSNNGGAQGRAPETARPSLRTMLTPTSKGNLNSPSMDKGAGARALRALMESRGVGGTVALARICGWMMGYPRGWLDDKLRR